MLSGQYRSPRSAPVRDLENPDDSKEEIELQESKLSEPYTATFARVKPAIVSLRATTVRHLDITSHSFKRDESDIITLQDSAVHQIDIFPGNVTREIEDGILFNFFNTLTSVLIANEKLAIQVTLNIFRDFWWTWWSYANFNYAVNETDDANYDIGSQWFGQQVWGTTAIAAGFLFLLAVYKYNARKMPVADALIYALAAATAIFTWDYGQTLGIQLGQDNLNMSPLGAAMFASVFTGGFEGPTQYLVITAGNLIKDQEVRNKYRRNPVSRISGELVLSATIGALPGGDWEIAYVGGVNGNWGLPGTSTVVAATVATLNVVTTKINDKIIACVENRFSRDRVAVAGTLFHHQEQPRRTPVYLLMPPKPNQIAPAPAVSVELDPPPRRSPRNGVVSFP